MTCFQAFAIEEKIGAGCFGTVYKVRSKEDGKLYAVKIARYHPYIPLSLLWGQGGS